MALRWLHSADEALRDRDEAPFSICECLNIRVAPLRGVTDNLLQSLFRPCRAVRFDMGGVDHLLVRALSHQARGTAIPKF
jgi:hypothetical protein